MCSSPVLYKSHINNSQGGKFKKKTSLLQKLKKKLHARSSKDESQSTESEDENVKDKRRKTLKGNSNAVKDGRTIKMGWKHFENSDYIQVRSDKGGGTDDFLCQKVSQKQIY